MLTSIDSRIIIVRRTLIMYYFIGNFNIFNLDSVWLYALARSKHIHKWQLFKLMLAEKISCHKRFKLSNCRRCERDLSRGHLKWWFSWGNLPFKKMPLIQGFEIYNSLHRYISNIYIYTHILKQSICTCIFCASQFFWVEFWVGGLVGYLPTPTKNHAPPAAVNHTPGAVSSTAGSPGNFKEKMVKVTSWSWASSLAQFGCQMWRMFFSFPPENDAICQKENRCFNQDFSRAYHIIS